MILLVMNSSLPPHGFEQQSISLQILIETQHYLLRFCTNPITFLTNHCTSVLFGYQVNRLNCM